MKKILVLIILILFLSGCKASATYKTEETDNYDYGVFVDKATCVEYLVSYEYKKGGIIVRYNQDGTIKVNNECLKDKGE